MYNEMIDKIEEGLPYSMLRKDFLRFHLNLKQKDLANRTGVNIARVNYFININLKNEYISQYFIDNGYEEYIEKYKVIMKGGKKYEKKNKVQ